MTARVVTAAVIFAFGHLGFRMARRATPDRVGVLRHLGHVLSLIWYLPLPLARAVYATLSLGLCGFAVLVLLGHVL